MSDMLGNWVPPNPKVCLLEGYPSNASQLHLHRLLRFVKFTKPCGIHSMSNMMRNCVPPHPRFCLLQVEIPLKPHIPTHIVFEAWSSSQSLWDPFLCLPCSEVHFLQCQNFAYAMQKLLQSLTFKHVQYFKLYQAPKAFQHAFQCPMFQNSSPPTLRGCSLQAKTPPSPHNCTCIGF